jgi:glutamate-1-semialdehyde 2,1-aminomutase
MIKKAKKTIALWNKAKKLIPGGSQLLSKRAEMFLPEQWPAYFKRAKGIEVWDLDDNKYLDLAYMGLGACILGYADPDVNLAVKKAVDAGSVTTLNCPEEVELAELLLELHPWAGMVRYARTGGEAAAIAVRIARAYTGKDKVAFCGYHGWHDWYLASNLASKKNLDGHLLKGLEPSGVPRGLLGTAIPFEYNNIDQLEEIVKKNKIGAIIMEPMRHQEPRNNFLKKIRKIADRINAVLIFDEISSGFRMNIGGTHLTHRVYPDIAVFGKAISNGYPMAAVIGRKKIMDAAQATFISSTHWTERIGPVATLATIRKLKKENVSGHIDKIGKIIAAGWQKLAKKHGLDLFIGGPSALVNFSFNYPNRQELVTLFTQEMLARGFLAKTTVYLSYAHTPALVKKYLQGVDQVFALIAKGIKEKSIAKMLKGPIAHTGFRRLT